MKAMKAEFMGGPMDRKQIWVPAVQKTLAFPSYEHLKPESVPAGCPVPKPKFSFDTYHLVVCTSTFATYAHSSHPLCQHGCNYLSPFVLFRYRETQFEGHLAATLCRSDLFQRQSARTLLSMLHAGSLARR
jgi:hypothetical protein